MHNSDFYDLRRTIFPSDKEKVPAETKRSDVTMSDKITQISVLADQLVQSSLAAAQKTTRNFCARAGHSAAMIGQSASKRGHSAATTRHMATAAGHSVTMAGHSTNTAGLSAITTCHPATTAGPSTAPLCHTTTTTGHSATMLANLGAFRAPPPPPRIPPPPLPSN